jgi:transcription initiation factor TFIIIB Brf1 subunit/transcription initiation factor TFIIB
MAKTCPSCRSTKRYFGRRYGRPAVICGQCGALIRWDQDYTPPTPEEIERARLERELPLWRKPG